MLTKFLTQAPLPQIKNYSKDWRVHFIVKCLVLYITVFTIATKYQTIAVT